jgi:hypothetical protein
MRRLSAVAVICFLIAATLRAQDRGPSTAEERATAVKLARLLENDPLDPHAKDARQWFTVWLIAVPDITVSACGDLLGPTPRSAKKYSSELMVQALYSSAAFMIEHPEKVQDKVAIHQAGLEGTLKAYASIRKQQPKYDGPLLNDLQERQARGELRAYAESAAEKCASTR